MTVVGLVAARGGSKRLPRKNLRPLGGVPLLVHAIECAVRCPSIERVVVSTEADELASLAAAHGTEVIVRPPELSAHDASTWSVVRHAAAQLEPLDVVALLQPTSPLRLPEDVEATLALLAARADADGAVAVVDAPGAGHAADAGGVLDFGGTGARVTGAVYAWRREFVRRETEDWRRGRNAPYRMPAERAVDIDGEDDLRRAEELLATGIVALPWLAPAHG